MVKNKNSQYRDRLKKIISKKILTATIYSLSQFEVAFGSFFGFGKDESELTSEERINRQKWINVRENILNNGHRQESNALRELDMHDVVWNRYQTTFLPKTQEENFNR